MDNIPEAMKEREQMVYEAFERVTLSADMLCRFHGKRENRTILDNDIEILRAELGFTNYKGNGK